MLPLVTFAPLGTLGSISMAPPREMRWVSGASVLPSVCRCSLGWPFSEKGPLPLSQRSSAVIFVLFRFDGTGVPCCPCPSEVLREAGVTVEMPLWPYVVL